MSSPLIAIVSMITGALVGGLLGFNFGTGVGATAAMDQGFSAGACAAMFAARGQGLVTDADFDPVLSAAAKMPAGGLQPDAQLSDMAAKCDELFEELRQSEKDRR